MKSALRALSARAICFCTIVALAACAGGGTGQGPSNLVPAGATTPGATRNADSAIVSSSPKFQYFIGQYDASVIARDAVASAALNGTHPYVALDSASAPYPVRPFAPPAWGAIYVARWGSETQMISDMPKVPSWISTCMYDNEPNATPVTPIVELANPAIAYAAAAASCHNAGKTFIATAGLSGGNVSRQAVFNTAKTWDGYSMQTQTALMNIPAFDAMIASYRSSVLAVNPKANKFIAGVGDFASGTLASLPQIEAAARSIPAGTAVWLNFGAHAYSSCTDTRVCPIPARRDLEIQLIKDLATH